MTTKNGMFIGLLQIDAKNVVISAKIPMINATEEAEWEGKTLEDLFLQKEGVTLARLEKARRERSEIDCLLPNNRPAQLFLADRADQQGLYFVYVLFTEEESIGQNTMAHASFRTTLASVISGFAHEVRNPLAAMMSLTEGVLARSPLDNYTEQSLHKITKLIGRIENLLKNTLNYGKPKPPNLEWHQINQLIDETIESVQLSLHTQSTFQQRLTPKVIPVYIDSMHAVSVLTNLLTNAIQSTESAQEISIHSHSPTSDSSVPLGFIAIDISDEGEGVPLSLQERIFEPFFTTKARGTGLGLALARDLARINGGDLLLLRSSPAGSTFRFLLRIRAPMTVRVESKAALVPALLALSEMTSLVSL
jgi:signal transduction histidine kinase